jgi:hypothetical protein
MRWSMDLSKKTILKSIALLCFLSFNLAWIFGCSSLKSGCGTLLISGAKNYHLNSSVLSNISQLHFSDRISQRIVHEIA